MCIAEFRRIKLPVHDSEFIESNCFSKERISHLGVPFLQMNQHWQEIHRDRSKECSCVSHDVTNVWVYAGERKRYDGDKDIEHNKITFVHCFFRKENIEELSPEE